MAIVTIDDTNLTDIANAIRAKKGNTSMYKPSEMADAINSLSVGGGNVTLAHNKLAKVVDKSITEVTAEDLEGATSIGDMAFYYCKSLTSINIPNSVTSIGGMAFYYCENLADVTIGNGVTRIDSEAFYNCSLTSINIPDSVTSIGELAFYNCSLTSINIPNSVTSIGGMAFYNCSLTSINIPDSVTSIEGSTFENCTSLTSINIPNSVTSIGTGAFENCISMQYYDFSQHTSVPTLEDEDVFSGIPSACEIRVPAALYDEWIAATNWVTYADNIVAV